MHELSIALNIVEVAQEEAERRGETSIAAIHLRLGPLCGVVQEALQSAFSLAREGTCLAGAELVIEQVPVVVHCSTCGAERAAVSIQQLGCPACGGDARVVSGHELEVVALEIRP